MSHRSTRLPTTCADGTGVADVREPAEGPSAQESRAATICAQRQIEPLDSGRPRMPSLREKPMRLKVLLHAAEEGGFWAEAPALPGCVSQGETADEALQNIREAAAGWLDVAADRVPADARLVEIEV